MHENALTPTAKKLFPSIARFKKFYLVGGTGLALQIGHRLSVDFDLFTHSTSLQPSLLQTIKRVYRTHLIAVTYHTSEQINLLIDGIKFTFFAYPYPLMNPCIHYRGVSIASLMEIAAMKAHAIGNRLAYKDYVDWYFLLADKKMILSKIIRCAEKKFDRDFNSRLFLGQLVSFEDVREQKIDFLGKDIERSTIKGFLKKKVQEVMERYQ